MYMLQIETRRQANGRTSSKDEDEISVDNNSEQVVTTEEVTSSRDSNPLDATRRGRRKRQHRPKTKVKNHSDPKKCTKLVEIHNIPNLRWRAPTSAELRTHPRYIALPPMKEDTPPSEQDAPITPQNSWQWDALHTGRLTTSIFAAGLGFYEKSAIRFAGLPQSAVCHDRLLETYHRVRKTTRHTPTASIIPPSPSVISQVVDQILEYNDENLNVKCHHNGDDDVGVHHLVCAMRAARLGFRGVAMAWGNFQEPAGIYAVLQAFKLSIVLECGMFPLYPDVLPSLKQITRGIFLVGASPDGVLCFSASAAIAAGVKANMLSLPPPPEYVLFQLGAMRGSFLTSIAASVHRHVAARKLQCAEDDIVMLPLEIKCRSPFREKSQRSRAGSQKCSPQYLCNEDLEPYDSIPPYHIPQIQLHALALGAGGAVVCMYCASTGSNIFYVSADRKYQAQTLQLVSGLVCRTEPPPADPFVRSNIHRKMYHHTVKASQYATQVATTRNDESSLWPGVMNSEPFLEEMLNGKNPKEAFIS